MIWEQGAIDVIPPKANRKLPAEFDAEIYRERKRIERLEVVPLLVPLRRRNKVDRVSDHAASFFPSQPVSYASAGVNAPSAEWGRSSLWWLIQLPIPALASEPVSKAWR